jgi:hypothetical protein
VTTKSSMRARFARIGRSPYPIEGAVGAARLLELARYRQSLLMRGYIPFFVTRSISPLAVLGLKVYRICLCKEHLLR